MKKTPKKNTKEFNNIIIFNLVFSLEFKIEYKSKNIKFYKSLRLILNKDFLFYIVHLLFFLY